MGSKHESRCPEVYTEADVVRRIKTAPNVVVIQAESDLEIPVEIEIHDTEPAYSPDEWDHIAEASLHLPSGQLKIHECTGGPVAEFEIVAGWYRVRSFHGGFDTIESATLGGDYYKVVLWPAPPADILVVKQYPVAGAAA